MKLVFYSATITMMHGPINISGKTSFIGNVFIQGGLDMTGTKCGLCTHKSIPVIFEPPCILWPLEYLNKKSPVATKQAEVSLIMFESCSTSLL